MAVVSEILQNPVLRGVSPADVVVLLVGTVAVAVILPVLVQALQRPRFPSVNGKPGWFSNSDVKKNFAMNAKKLMMEGDKLDRPYHIMTDSGPKIMLPASYIEAVNNEPNLSFDAAIRKEMLSSLPGFEAFQGSPNHMVEEAVRVKLTQNLPKFTKALSEEVSMWLDERWGEGGDWQDLVLKPDVQNLVSRLSALIFVGPELARNAEWQRISVDYTVDLFLAVQDVKLWSEPLQRLAVYVEPRCRKLRQEYKTARAALAPILEERNRLRAEAKAAGRPEPQWNDMLTWVQQTSKGADYDPLRVQLSLTMAAIHTTSDLLSQALFNICQHPEIIPALREEALRVVNTHGWSKTSLYELHLLDSVLKETQRIKPAGMSFMMRRALADCKLPGDVKIRKGEHIMISQGRMWDDGIYSNAEKFDPYRYQKLRDEDKSWQHKSHFVSTSTESTGFSHGKHACPGRFFAANEAKIALVHMLLKYDIRLKEGEMPMWIEWGGSMQSSSTAKIQFKRRDIKVDI